MGSDEERTGIASAQRSSNQPRLLVGRSLKERFPEMLPKLIFDRGLEVSQAGVRKPWSVLRPHPLCISL